LCDTLVQVGRERVLFAKSSDRDPNEAQHLAWIPAATHREAEVRCTWVAVPQVSETRAVLLSKPFWIWGAEMGANDAGVVIGNEAVFTRPGVPDVGLTGMDLVRLALERASTAREAVEVVIEHLERFGQGGGCGHEDRRFRYASSFLVADASGAVVLETSGSGRWVTEAVQGARSLSNGLTVAGFAEAHGRRLHTAVAGADARRARTERCADAATGPLDLFRGLRDHGAGQGSAPRYSWINGAMAGPCVHASGLLAASQTTASWVSELGPRGARHWATATAAPCTSLFKPVAVGDPLDLGPDPTDRFDPRALWWRHERLHRAIAARGGGLPSAIADERDATERRWVADPPAPADAFAEADALLDRWTAEVEASPPRDVRPWWVRRYHRIRAGRAGLPG
jgi:secernin